MRKLITVLTVGQLFLSLAFAQSQPPEGMGFHTLESTQIPDAVKRVSHSVFRVVVPSGERVKLSSIEMFSGKSTSEIIQLLKTSDQLDQFDRDSYIHQVEICAGNLDCEIFEGNETGTAYLLGDGRSLVTAFHTFKSQLRSRLKMTEATGPISFSGVMVFSYDLSGRLVYGPQNGSVDLVISAETNTVAAMGGVAEGIITPPIVDVAVLELQKSIGLGLQTATFIPQVGDEVYVMGFPMLTSDRGAFGALDSNGIDLYVSKGKLLNLEQALKRQGRDISQMGTEEREFYDRNTWFAAADGARGFSGGPMLNAKGEVLGTFTAAYPQINADPNHVSYSSRSH